MARGWIEAADEGYQATAEGSKIRQQSEDETNRLYKSAWSTLNANEQQELADLLIELESALQETASV